MNLDDDYPIRINSGATTQGVKRLVAFAFNGINANDDNNLINPFHATDLFWYPLKTSENQRFSGGYQKISVAWNG